MGFMRDIGDHLKHRLNPKTILKEAMDTATERVGHGANEMWSAINTGSAYQPLQGQGDHLIQPMPQAEAEVAAPAHSNHFEPGPAEPNQMASLDAYMSGYAPAKPEMQTEISAPTPVTEIGPPEPSPSLDGYMTNYRDMGMDR